MSTPRYRYVENHRAHKVLTFDDPKKAEASITGPPASIKKKANFREWCSDPNTKSAFFNTVEGDNPNARVTDENPVRFLHGFVADYDSPVKDWSKIEEDIKTRCVDCPIPTWVSKTFSGYLRIVWEFEKPMPLDPQLAGKFISNLVNFLCATRLHAGFDNTSTKPSQYFALGTDWKKIGGRISPKDIHQVLFKTANTVPLKSSETNIPLAEVEKEVHKRYPGRWVGPFEVGARGPLFWIDDGVAREGCQLREEGIVCYSERAGKGFVTWSEVLGKKFVAAFEAKKIESVGDQFWTDGTSYYKVINNSPDKISEKHLFLSLKRLGFDPRTKKGKNLSEVEEALLHIDENCRVDAIAPVIFSKEKLVNYAGRRILNSNKKRPIQPAASSTPAQWMFIRKLLWQMFARDAEGKRTLTYFLCWFKRFYEATLYYRFDQGQMLILIGPTGQGKTLISSRLIGQATGGYADASDYLCGGTNFTKELSGTATWLVDDNQSFATYSDHRKFLELTKRAVANPRVEYHKKGIDSCGIPWAGRVVMSLNTDANSLAALPSLDSSNRDKVLALSVDASTKMKFGSNKETEASLKEELPYFLHWLTEKFQIPERLKSSSRFGIKTYIDPTIESAAFDNSNRSLVGEIIDFFAKRYRGSFDDISTPLPDFWQGTLTEFQVLLHELNNGRFVGKSGDLDFIRRGMSVIEETGHFNRNVRPVKSEGIGAGKVWKIFLAEKFDLANTTPMLNGNPHGQHTNATPA